MNSSIIELKDIYKSWMIGDEEEFVALKGVNLSIKQGEFSAITGPSGSGKSTLMHVIGLLDKPTSGEVVIDNKNILSLDDDETSTLRSEFVGFVFQQFNLLNKLTVQENILLPTTYARKKFAYNPLERAEYLMDRFGILSKRSSYPNKISGGQQQRVAIARSLIMNPRLILADEPTGNLDTKTGDEIMKLFQELNETEKITIVLVTHEPDIAKKTRRSIHVLDGMVTTT
ncbi:ABC transporter ATP-binding protein [Candidatus Collierbacteria bacterium RIFOXYD1_FULL_40_9]|uniref:ABC transporter ATP-binding protein n=1 Tax=Candidatus Collierbacteria bacterium RIFOXYD1_FULL_40_9 TaxID=1817731 RepID=A0A1F5FW42_9BACT|nr:MAG: ABC transporter ATP-binding protein [Candidatus Collierbacteria bacterium RIFOXYD1_FULL_40_9]